MKIDDLPESVRQIVEVLGFDDALRVVNVYGGTYIPISVQPRKDVGSRLDIIERWVGKKKMMAFVERFAGTTPLYIPRCTQALKRERDRAICAEYDRGASTAELVLRHGIGERQIKRILKESPDKAA